LEFDHRLLDVRLDAAEYAREEVVAEEERFGGDRLAMVVALAVVIPALLTRMSRRPCCSITSPTVRRQSSAEAMLPW
jgi:hypothetical protein